MRPAGSRGGMGPPCRCCAPPANPLAPPLCLVCRPEPCLQLGTVFCILHSSCCRLPNGTQPYCAPVAPPADTPRACSVDPGAPQRHRPQRGVPQPSEGRPGRGAAPVLLGFEPSQVLHARPVQRRAPTMAALRCAVHQPLQAPTSSPMCACLAAPQPRRAPWRCRLAASGSSPAPQTSQPATSWAQPRWCASAWGWAGGALCGLATTTAAPPPSAVGSRCGAKRALPTSATAASPTAAPPAGSWEWRAQVGW